MEKSLKLLKVSGRTRRSLEDTNNKLHNLLNILAKIVISMNMEDVGTFDDRMNIHRSARIILVAIYIY